MLFKVLTVDSHPKYSCCYTKSNDGCIQDVEGHIFTSDVKQELFEVGEILFYTKEILMKTEGSIFLSQTPMVKMLVQPENV